MDLSLADAIAVKEDARRRLSVVLEHVLSQGGDEHRRHLVTHLGLGHMFGRDGVVARNGESIKL